MLIETKWPILDRAKIQLFSMNTPNGIKAAVALEELGLPYEPHLVNIIKGDQKTDEFRSISPNQKIPAIVEFVGPQLEPLALAESGAILIHLAQKAGRLIPTDSVHRLQCMQWLFLQVGQIGPIFGQFGRLYKNARDHAKKSDELDYFTQQATRELGVLERQLGESEYLLSEYSIADIATFPWVNALTEHYHAVEWLDLASYGNIQRWLTACNQRPAAQAGKKVNAAPD